jgi:hypothetical protein
VTIDSAYWPERRNNHGGTVYQFEFEIIDPTYLEIYTIDSDDVYTIVDPADYTVMLGTYITPISRGGRVTFNDPLSADVLAISIQRKTNITDEQEFTTGQPFNAESFEFQCDKLTMILQEINASVCDCSGVEEPEPPDPVYCKVYECDAYKTAGESLFQNFWPMDGSGANTAPGGVGLANTGGPFYGEPSSKLLTDSCPGVDGVRVTGSAGLYSTSSAVVSPGKNGMVAGFLKLSGGNSVTIISNKYYSKSGTLELIDLSWVSGGSGGLRARFTFRGDVQVTLVNVPSGLSVSTPKHVFFAWRIVDETPQKNRRVYFSLYIDFVEIITSNALFISADGTPLNWNPDFRIGDIAGTGQCYAQFVGQSPYAPADLADVAPIVAALQEAYQRNDVDYVDPDPECVPAPE